VAQLRPFVALAERLGRFSVQLDPERLGRVELTLAGAIAESDPELLARAVLAGLLGPVMAGPVNLVNARLVAVERGVEVRIERQPETTGYKSVLSIATETRRWTENHRWYGFRRSAADRPAPRSRHRVRARGLYSRAVLRGPSGDGGKNRLNSRT